ncbi:hypothetical protein [Actinomadura rugatobispora]|uniref:ABC transporter permease n=1 Tax=Actinomadura rugatobispora TaxID=1994 RepID=A0ABW0ZMC7_9ACTN|nr:exporter of polyketide antibiotics [Actinomadura rugatobispora]
MTSTLKAPGARQGKAAPKDRLAGTGTLFRLGLRRERHALPAWLLANAALLGGTAAAYGAAFTDAEARAAAIDRSESALLRALNGAPAGDGIGSLAVTDTFTATTTLASLMAVAMVLRQTRQNDESGRAELLASTAVGRHAPLLAALLLGVAACAALVPVLALALALGGLPVAGSVAAAAAIAATGLVFAAVATMTAQLWPSTTASTWDAILVIFLVFLPRAIGDALGGVPAGGLGVSRGWISWISPVTWAQEIRPFHGDRWVLLVPLVALSVPIAAQGFRLSTKRDPGSSVIDTGKGPAAASPSLRGPWSLGRRLYRTAMKAWVAGSILGFLCAGLLGAGDDASAVAMADLVAIVAVCHAAHVLAGLRSEETTGGLAMTLAGRAGRGTWLLARLGHGAAGLAAVVLAAGLGASLGTGLRSGDLGGGLAETLAVSLVQTTAALAFAGLAVAAFGALPRLFLPLLWAGPVATALLAVAASEPDAGPVAGLTAVAAILAALVLGALGTVAFGRRDVGG